MRTTLSELKATKQKNKGYITRQTKHSMYNNAAWRTASKRYRHEHPYCVECDKQGKTKPVSGRLGCVDHIVPHNGDIDLFWNQDNWQALCWDCHRIKTQAEKKGVGG